MARTVKYPIGIQSFSKIREDNFTYVDKTEIIYNLVNTGQYYFLSRPRRFGKSLLLSTIKAYFEGRQDLFKGLAIEHLEKEWKKYPVILLSLAGYNPSESDLKEILDLRLSQLEEDFGIKNTTSNPGGRFGNIIRGLYKKTGQQVVILVDEYDAPLVAHLDDDDNREAMRNLLKSVYSNLKDMDEYIKFGMLTGVSRFSKMTIFSGLNNLKDISLDDRFSEICGITESELETNFHEGIENLANELEIHYDSAIKELKANYDGYHFTAKSPDIYNPFSLLGALDASKIDEYWFRSGTPTFLVNVLRNQKEPFAKLFTEKVGEIAISDIDSYRTNPLALLFQTGYLTIKEYDKKRKRYTLGIPNREVESGLFTVLLADNANSAKYKIEQWAFDIREAFENGKPEEALKLIKSFFAGIPANITQNKSEIYFENNLYMLLSMIGCDVRAEHWTSYGRIDLLLKTEDNIYVMELKLDSTPEAALNQIEQKEYALQWNPDNRKVFKIGINFSSKTRNLDSWVIE